MTHELLANEMKAVLERAGDAELALVFATAISTSPEDWAGGLMAWRSPTLVSH